MKLKNIVLALILVFGVSSSFAQNLDMPVVVYLNNGSVVRGELISTSAGQVSLRIADGTILTYNTAEVHKISDNQLVVPPVNKCASQEGDYVNYGQAASGFYFAVESNTAVSIRPNKSNFGFEEIDLIGGYRWGFYFRAGLGFGARYYWENTKVRYHNRALTMPVFIDFRGDFMSRAYRTIVPYWNVQTGANLGDGYMIRPTIGMRIGERRSAFLLGISYNGQILRGLKSGSFYERKSTGYNFVSFISLKLGYEF